SKNKHLGLILTPMPCVVARGLGSHIGLPLRKNWLCNYGAQSLAQKYSPVEPKGGDTMTFYIKKTYVDTEPDIELVNIHYTWTPVSEMPNWEAHRETRAMPRGGVLVRGMGGTTLDESGQYVQTASDRIELSDDGTRRKVLRLPKAIPDPATGGYT